MVCSQTGSGKTACSSLQCVKKVLYNAILLVDAGCLLAASAAALAWQSLVPGIVTSSGLYWFACHLPGSTMPDVS